MADGKPSNGTSSLGDKIHDRKNEIDALNERAAQLDDDADLHGWASFGFAIGTAVAAVVPGAQPGAVILGGATIVEGGVSLALSEAAEAKEEEAEKLESQLRGLEAGLQSIRDQEVLGKLGLQETVEQEIGRLKAKLNDGSPGSKPNGGKVSGNSPGSAPNGQSANNGNTHYSDARDDPGGDHQKNGGGAANGNGSTGPHDNPSDRGGSTNNHGHGGARPVVLDLGDNGITITELSSSSTGGNGVRVDLSRV